MPHLLASNNKSPRFPTSNNKDIQRMAVKQLPSYYGATNMPNISDSLNLGPPTVDVRSCESKRMMINKDIPMTTANATTKKQNNSDLLIPVASMKKICCRTRKCANIENNNNKQDGRPTHIRVIRR